MFFALLLLIAAYLIGAIPFGYLIGRARGVDLFKEGSGNIGATNAARVLGRTWGIIVFVLDFAKGAVPVAAIVPLAKSLSPSSENAFGDPSTLRVLAAALAFLGHLFPIYLRFRGGKGVATGAGTVAVLVPGPAFLAVLFWIVVMLATRMVSPASLAAIAALVAARIFVTPEPFAAANVPVTLYVLAGSAFVAFKHRTNVARLIRGEESCILADSERRQTTLRVFHVLALGMWFGGAGFFNFGAALPIFASFKDVVNAGPSDRTANEEIIREKPGELPEEWDKRKEDLANALAGSAVGPVFPIYFAMQVACGAIALITALTWWNSSPDRSTHRRRVYVLVVALLSAVIGWVISSHVSELRMQRFSMSDEIRKAARAAFGPWHMVSLLLSFVTVLLAGAGLAMATKLPSDSNLPDAEKITSPE